MDIYGLLRRNYWGEISLNIWRVWYLLKIVPPVRFFALLPLVSICIIDSLTCFCFTTIHYLYTKPSDASDGITLPNYILRLSMQADILM